MAVDRYDKLQHSLWARNRGPDWYSALKGCDLDPKVTSLPRSNDGSIPDKQR